MRVGLFDSGVGGLTVLKKLMHSYPNNEYIYYGDTLNNPYGNKSLTQLNILASKSIEFLLSKKVDIIIIACGTISSNCYTYLKAKYNIPIYDIISPTINYLNEKKYENVLILATERTISSHIFQNNITYGRVYEEKGYDLAYMIENAYLANVDVYLKKILNKYIGKIDAIVLGCTHYPILRPNLEKIFGSKVIIIDMGECLLDKLSDGDKADLKIYFSKTSDKTNKLVRSILEKNL